MSFTGDFETIALMVSAPMTLTLVGVPIIIIVIVIATLWNKR